MSFQLFIKRDYGIKDEETMLTAVKTFEGFPWPVYRLSTQLYMVTSAIDLGYTKWDSCRTLIESLVQSIVDTNISSWEEYGDAFLLEERDSGHKNLLRRKALHTQVRLLHNDAASPWVNLAWEKIPSVLPPSNIEAITE